MFFEGAIERQKDRALLGDARLDLPTVSMPGIDQVWFGEKFMAPIRFGLGLWQFRFMTLEMEAVAIFVVVLIEGLRGRNVWKH